MAFPPIVLLADSQLLFHRTSEGASWMSAMAERSGLSIQRAAYLGASNGDQPEFFELFRAAVGDLSLDECRHVPAEASADDLQYVDHADLILLAGGDVRRGLEAFERGLRQTIVDAYLRGALLVGVSAGAVQLGTMDLETTQSNGSATKPASDDDAVSGFRFAPFVIDVHAEPEWAALRSAVRRRGSGGRGIGIPSGGGAIFHRDGSLEPVRRPLFEIVVDEEGRSSEALLVADPLESGVPPERRGPE